MFLFFQTNFYTFTLVKYTIANVSHVNSHQMDFTKCTHKFHVIVLKIFNLPFFSLLSDQENGCCYCGCVFN